AREPAGAVPLPTDPLRRSGTRRAARGRRRMAGWVAAAALAVAAVTGALWLRTPPADVTAPVVHRTDYGEQRSIALADGSIVVLNTLSEVAVRFSPEERRVELVSGEAMFD